MTENNAAQPPLTDDQIEALAKKHIAPHADRLDAIMANPVPYQQTEQFRRVKALIVDVLSNLRVPVADERTGAAEHYDEVKATLQGAHRIMEGISAIERRVGPIGSHARGYTHKITNALRHLGALYAAPQASAADFPSIDPVQAHVAHCHGCETCDGWHDMLGSQRQASTVDGLPIWWGRFMSELTLRSEGEVRNDLPGILEICALEAIGSVACQASEAVRIQFPAHLRKMWSGREVQAWLDEHQGVTPPKVSAKESLERYRKWQAEREEAFGAGVKAAADLVKKTVEDYDANHGSTDCETGTREYPGEGATWVCEMQELEESIRALSVQPARKPATSAPSPAASQRQAMIPASRESGNSHTDGGAVYE